MGPRREYLSTGTHPLPRGGTDFMSLHRERLFAFHHCADGQTHQYGGPNSRSLLQPTIQARKGKKRTTGGFDFEVQPWGFQKYCCRRGEYAICCTSNLNPPLQNDERTIFRFKELNSELLSITLNVNTQSSLTKPGREGVLYPSHLEKGKKVKLSDFRGKNNVVLSFYPLAWTPV